MRSNRPSYASAPASSSKVLDQKPRPKRSKKEWNQLLLMLFFMVLPVLGLLSIFFQPIRWVFIACIAICLALMWFIHAFLFPGRMILTAVYGLLLVLTLVSALNTQGSRRINNGSASPFAQVTATIAPTQVPVYSYGYSSTENGYDDSPDFQEVALSGGSEDQSDGSNWNEGATDVETGRYTSDVKTEAEIALENFMEKWRKGIIADMVEHTPPSWRNSQADSAQQQLFWKFAQKPLLDWRQMSSPTGTDDSTARTISIEADISYSGETRTYAYDAIALFENDAWYIDPDSLSSGILKLASTPTPDPNMTPAPTPTPTPTPAPSSKTKLYYNKNGGKYYHADPECSSVAKEFLPLTSFTYGNLNKSPYTKLQPCPKCDAPSRK